MLHSSSKLGGALWLAAACAVVVLLTACGGGGGGGGDLRLSGTVSRAPSTEPGKGERGIDVFAYVFPDLATSVTQTRTDQEGRYTLTVPARNAGKDVVLVARYAARSGSPRYSCIIADVKASGTTLADLDFATTVAAELGAYEAKRRGTDDLSGTAIETIAAEARAWEGIRNLDIGIDGPNLPATFGAGVKPQSPLDAFATSNLTVVNALAKIVDTSTGNTRKAKRMVQTIRDIGHALVDSGKFAEDSLANALAEQGRVMDEGFRTPAALGTRVDAVFQMLYFGEFFDYEVLAGREPGVYEWRPAASPERVMVKVANSADGKSWKVISKIPDATLDWEVSITPDNRIPEFDIIREAGRYVVAVRKPGQPTWKWDIVLAAVQDASQRITTISLSITATDPDLTAPFTFNGKVTGPATGTSDDPRYARLSLSGNLSSQFLTGQLDDLTVEWSESTQYLQDIKAIRMTNARLSTNFSKKMAVAITSASMEMWPADPRQNERFSVPKRCLLDQATVEGSGHKFTLSKGELTFDREIRADGNVDILPRLMKGTVRYTSPRVLFEGTVAANWTTLKSGSAFSGSEIRTSDFPVGTVDFEGRIQPTVGQGGDAKGQLVFSGTRTILPAVELKLTSLRYGDESITGFIKMVFQLNGDYVVLSDPDVTVQLTQSPTGMVMKMNGKGDGMTGWIATDSLGSNKIANIGKADDLGLPDLGSILIIRYNDNTFETFSSLMMH